MTQHYGVGPKQFTASMASPNSYKGPISYRNSDEKAFPLWFIPKVGILNLNFGVWNLEFGICYVPTAIALVASNRFYNVPLETRLLLLP